MTRWPEHVAPPCPTATGHAPPAKSAPADPAAANKADAARRLAAAPVFMLAELRRADPDAAEAERARALRMLGGRDTEQQGNDDAG